MRANYGFRKKELMGLELLSPQGPTGVYCNKLRSKNYKHFVWMKHLSRTGTRVVLEPANLIFPTRSPLDLVNLFELLLKPPQIKFWHTMFFAAPLNLFFSSTHSPLDLVNLFQPQIKFWHTMFFASPLNLMFFHAQSP